MTVSGVRVIRGTILGLVTAIFIALYHQPPVWKVALYLMIGSLIGLLVAIVVDKLWRSS